MTPLSFNFDALPPYSGRSQATRHTSRSGALVAQEKAPSQKARMIALYRQHGPLSDGEIAKAMGLPEGRISARRSALLADRVVEYHDIVPGPYGAQVTRWRLR